MSLAMTVSGEDARTVFAKIEGSRWRIIEKRGEIVDYWIKETEE